MPSWPHREDGVRQERDDVEQAATADARPHDEPRDRRDDEERSRRQDEERKRLTEEKTASEVQAAAGAGLDFTAMPSAARP